MAIAGVIEQDIDVGKRFEDTRAGILHMRVIADVTGHDQSANAQRLDFCGKKLQGFLPASDEGDIGTRSGQTQCNTAPDATGGTRDNGP